MKKYPKNLIDKGFDADFSPKRVNEFNDIFTPEKEIQDHIDKIHEEDNAIDMIRGEFYPEILRCVSTMKKVVSDTYKIEPDQCHPNFGSNGSIDTILTAMKLREINNKINSEIEGGLLVSTPTYFRNYNSSLAKQIRLIKVPLLKNWDFNVDSFIDVLIKQHPTVIFLVTPNNPTGIPIKDKDIIKIIQNTPDDTLIVMDRTLVNINNEISTRDLLSQFKNKQLVILHSFSKYLGLSHLRVGFALYSNLKTAKEIQPHLPLGLGIEGAIKAIKYIIEQGEMKPSDLIVSNIIKNKEILSEFCSHGNGFSITDFVANYCLLILPKHLKSQKVVDDLNKEGIYVMDGNDFPEPIEGIIRIHTGGKPEFMQQTVNVLKSLYF